MKNTAIILIASLLIIGIQSCNKIHKDTGVITEEPRIRGCLPVLESVEWIIRTQAEYEALASGSGTLCVDDSFPAIDFDNYTLLGRYASGDCKAKFFRQVLRDDQAKTMTFNILVKDRGSCKKLVYSWNWVLVPKFPADYTVLFNVETK